MTGILVCIGSLVIGGLIGIRIGKRITDQLQGYMMQIFGLICFLIAFTSIVRATDLLAVTFSILIGGWIGYVLNLESRVKSGAAWLAKRVGSNTQNEDAASKFSAFLAIICVSSAGIVGSLTAGIDGDQSMLFVKAVLDFPVSCIFAAVIGVSVFYVCIPEAIFFSSLFFLAKFISPILTEACIGNLYACGGMIILTSGLKLLELRDFPTMTLLPALVLVVPITCLL